MIQRRGLRGPAAVRLGDPPGLRPGHPPVHRPAVRRSGAPTSATSGASATGPDASPPPPTVLPPGLAQFLAADARRRAAAEPQGVRPGVGPRVLDRHGRRASCDHERMLRGGEGAGAAHPPLPPHRRGDRAPAGRPVGPAGPPGRASWCAAAGQRFDYRSFPEMGHAMHRIDPKLYATTVRDWLAEVLP